MKHCLRPFLKPLPLCAGVFLLGLCVGGLTNPYATVVAFLALADGLYALTSD